MQHAKYGRIIFISISGLYRMSAMLMALEVDRISRRIRFLYSQMDHAQQYIPLCIPPLSTYHAKHFKCRLSSGCIIKIFSIRMKILPKDRLYPVKVIETFPLKSGKIWNYSYIYRYIADGISPPINLYRCQQIKSSPTYIYNKNFMQIIAYDI